MKTLSVLIPGLLGPLPELNNSSVELSACALLNKWLARAEQMPTNSDTFYKQLAELFSVQSNYSIAHASAHYDQCDCTAGFWYRADPVHFKADKDHAVLLDHQLLDIDIEEARLLVETFNQHFSEDGLKLVMADAHRWYLQSQTDLNITTTTLGESVSRNVSHFLPAGEGALNWRRLLNEAQMLFHTHPVNQQRENDARPGINSVWIWGEGDSAFNQSAASSPAFKWVMSNEPVSAGLAKVTGCDYIAMPDFDRDSIASVSDFEADGLIVIDHVMAAVNYGDVSSWNNALMEFCREGLPQLEQLLKQRKFQQIDLYTADGRKFIITARKLLKFWRRSGSIKQYMM